MNNKQLILFALIILLVESVFCQNTYVNGSFTSESNGEKGRLYSVNIDRTKGKTYVTIEIMATQNHRFLSVFTGNNCRIKADDWVSDRCYGDLQSDGSTIDISCGYSYSDWGWKNVKSGEKHRYTLVFDAIPSGLTSFSLVDEGTSYSSCHGYSFSGYTINNPRIGETKWTASSIKQFCDKNNDGICGIYESSDENGYKLGCIKQNGEYRLIFLGGKENRSWWQVGDLKAILRSSATDGVFKAEWYMANKSVESDCYVFFDGSTMNTLIGNEKTFYLKMYPTSSSKGGTVSEMENWSGTGFALNKGHIVTNYHVVEDAKSISVSGINGDFTKSFQASVVATDKVNDLAILKISDNNFTGFGALPYSIRWQMAEVGDDVFVLGYPLTQTMGEEIKLTNGIISSRTGFQGDASLYQMSAPIQPGNSGGPMFDSKGNVIGIVCAQHRGTENVGYAIKTSYLKNLAESFSLTNLFPTNNTVSTLTLSGQVKNLKKYVYQIRCSSNYSIPDKSNAIIINVEDYYYKIETQSHIFKLLKIEISDSYTKIYKKITPKSQPTWVCCSHKQFIEDAETGIKYYLRNSSIEIEPSKTFLNSIDDVEIVETYPALGEKTKYILISSGSRYYGYYGYYRIKIRD
ncbi:MAG: trypsin-like peptidase domain-containing protein [Bacteroidales bacterium]|nr:trypsin-like peptidase domain-containing protein [Bacteroidales bacterium]